MKVGLIAQDVQAVLPEAVDVNSKGILSIRYTDLIPITIGAIQELNKTIQELDKMVKEQNDIINNLVNRIVILEKK